MRTHLGDDVLLDVLEGTASADAVRHAASCAECGRRVADAREAWSMASAVEPPAPPPGHFDAFPRRVARAIEAEPRPRRFAAFFAPALLAAAATVALAVFRPSVPGPAPYSPAPLVVASAAPADEAVTELTADEIAECGDVAACLAGLSDEESRALAEALRAELARGGDL